MDKVYLARARPLLYAAAGLLVAAGSASAQTVQFIGTTQGCFEAGCVVGASDTYEELTFHGGSFDVTTLGGNGTIGGTTADNLGHFVLTNGAGNYNGVAFTLFISLTAPSVNDETFVGELHGEVNEAGDGSLTIHFHGGPEFWSANGYLYSIVPDPITQIAVPGPGEERDAYLGGAVTAEESTVPEPISVVLLGSGLLGLGAVRRRRK